MKENRPPTLGEFLYNRMGGVINDTSMANLLSMDVADWFVFKSGRKTLTDEELSDLSAMTGVSEEELLRIQSRHQAWRNEMEENWRRMELENRKPKATEASVPESKRKGMSFSELMTRILSNIKEFLKTD